MSYDQQPPGPPYGQPPAPPGYGYGYPAPVAPPPNPGTNGFAVAGLILAFLLAPIGLILSLVGLIQAGRRGQKGKGLAIAGLIVSLLLTVGGGAIAYAVGSKVATLVDPGCTVAKDAVLDHEAELSDASTVKQAVTTVLAEFESAERQAKHDNVRAAVHKLKVDYTELLADINATRAPSAELQSRIEADAKAFDKLCSVDT